MNVVAFFHAYKFTHFSQVTDIKTKAPSSLTFTEKIKALLLGVSNPRPRNEILPLRNYQTFFLQSNKKIECWYLPKSYPEATLSLKGTVIICHGYGGNKSSMLDKAAIFDSLGFNVMLIDFMGVGGSEGNQTTIGYKEADEVVSAYKYLQNKGENNIYLFGTSMGAVAIMRAVAKNGIKPKAVILECPFGSMYETVCMRFKNMRAPVFPMAGLLVFWGGIQNGFWAFGHNPDEYAKNINCPALLLIGGKDKNVSMEETKRIFLKLPAKKMMKIYTNAGHENYLLKYRSEWTKDIADFTK